MSEAWVKGEPEWAHEEMLRTIRAMGEPVLPSEEDSAIEGVVGSIVVRQPRQMMFLRVLESEGLAGACHRALDIYLATGAHVAVVRLLPLQEWELTLDIRPREGGPPTP